jgi:murein DD-endopeptidase MepM/ murein hydrolase activator NlpD
LRWVLPPNFIAIDRILICVGGIPQNTFKDSPTKIKLFCGRFPVVAPFCGRFPLVAPLLIVIFLLFLNGCKTAEAPYRVDTATIGGVYHYVRSGETLWSISKQYGVDINTIAKVNDLENARSDIKRGQRLLIPGSATTRQAYTAPKTSFARQAFVWPVRGTVISPYGDKLDRTKNKGMDISAPEGTPVKASKAGKVVFCDEWLKGFGKTVILDHGDSFQTVYAYNSLILVNVGDVVEQNMVIAKVGRGGRAKMSSLHFEIRRDGEPQNPFYYLSQ